MPAGAASVTTLRGAAPADGGAASVEPAALLSIEDAARVLNVPVHWLRKKVTAREVPHTRLGKHVRFTRAHLDEIVAAGEQPVVAVTRLSDGVSRRARRTG
jgi:excisionase family DNA binding protein